MGKWVSYHCWLTLNLQNFVKYLFRRREEERRRDDDIRRREDELRRREDDSRRREEDSRRRGRRSRSPLGSFIFYLVKVKEG